MTDTPSRTSIVRERVPLFLSPGVVEWMGQHMNAGGLFASPGHAAECALARLRFEHETVRQQCSKRGASFRPAVFWKLYAKEIEETTPGRWVKRTDTSPRIKIYATVAVELLEWVMRHGTAAGPFETVGQAVDVGLHRLQELMPEGPPWLSVNAGKLYEQYVRLEKRD